MWRGCRDPAPRILRISAANNLITSRLGSKPQTSRNQDAMLATHSRMSYQRPSQVYTNSPPKLSTKPSQTLAVRKETPFELAMSLKSPKGRPIRSPSFPLECCSCSKDVASEVLLRGPRGITCRIFVFRALNVHTSLLPGFTGSSDRYVEPRQVACVLPDDCKYTMKEGCLSRYF